ncbi:MAG: PHB depolymerase family esterase [Polyangiales bacterium]
MTEDASRGDGRVTAIDAGDVADTSTDGADVLEDRDAAVDATADASDVEDASDSALRWDILLPDVRPVVDAAVDGTVTAADGGVAAMDVVAPTDRPDVVQAQTDVVQPQPDVVVSVDRPDVVAPQPDVVVPLDRPDVVIADTPDVVTPVDRPDVVTVDIPAVTDLGSPADAGGLPGPDPVSYTGSFTVRTGTFTANLTVNGNRRSVRLHVPTNAGTSPPLLLLFHGTNGDGSVVMTEANAVALANAEGVIVAAPSSRWLGVGDFDHATEETYWETQNNTNPNTNEDVLLVRAIMVEAQRVYGVDPTRIYAMGHSNGAFFAGFIATLLRDRIAAFSENSGGLVTCARTTSCRFQGAGSTCATLATRAGWCNCSGPELPMPLATTGRRVPGYITHGTNDPLVSVYYACTLQARMLALGMPVQISLFNGEGHVIPANWAQMVWPFFRPLRLTP